MKQHGVIHLLFNVTSLSRIQMCEITKKMLLIVLQNQSTEESVVLRYADYTKHRTLV